MGRLIHRSARTWSPTCASAEDNPDVDTRQNLERLGAQRPAPASTAAPASSVGSGVGRGIGSAPASASALQAASADRVRANQEQFDRFREVPDGRDFYSPTSSALSRRPHAHGRSDPGHARRADSARTDLGLTSARGPVVRATDPVAGARSDRPGPVRRHLRGLRMRIAEYGSPTYVSSKALARDAAELAATSR